MSRKRKAPQSWHSNGADKIISIKDYIRKPIEKQEVKEWREDVFGGIGVMLGLFFIVFLMLLVG